MYFVVKNKKRLFTLDFAVQIFNNQESSFHRISDIKLA